MPETYTLEEPEIDRYKRHGTTYIDFFVPSNSETIRLCGLDKLPKPKYAWVKRPNSEKPRLVISSGKTNGILHSLVEFDQDRTLESIVVQLLQRKSGICENSITPVYK